MNLPTSRQDTSAPARDESPPRDDRASVRLGLRLPNGQSDGGEFPLAAIAEAAEDAGWDSLWVSDHVAVPPTSSDYPYTDDGRLDRATAAPWYDAVVTMSIAAAATSRVEVGTCVLVLALRNPIVAAKQIASLDAIAGGRVSLGVGSGWLREEFELLGVAFERRGRRLDEAIAVLRELWTGRPAEFHGDFFDLPADLKSYPVPAHRVPLLIGGMTEVALERVARIGDGWMALQQAKDVDPVALRVAVETIRSHAARFGRPAFRPRVLLRVRGGIEGTLARLPDLVEAGVTDVIVDVNWSDPTDVQKAHQRLRNAFDGRSQTNRASKATEEESDDPTPERAGG